MHVVFGTGAVGHALVDELVARELPVRAVNRSGPAGLPDSVDVIAGDAADPELARAAAAGASTVYQVLNPPYHRWAEMFPPLQDSAVQAARSAGARYVSFENVYLYGDTEGEPMTESTSQDPHTRKGRVRKDMADALADLASAGALDVRTARASDYFGPRATDQSQLGERVIGRALAGKSAQVIGDPSHLHSYTFTRDAAVALAVLGTTAGSAGDVWHVPNAPAVTTNEIVEMIGDEIGVSLAASPVPRLLLRLLGLFNPTVRELSEMMYEFEQPFVVDSSKFEQAFGIGPTPLDESIGATVDWWQERTAS